MVQDDLHLARGEQLAVDGAKLVEEGFDPTLHRLLVHAPAGGQLPERHGVWRYGMVTHCG